jgi:hypothetical protein
MHAEQRAVEYAQSRSSAEGGSITGRGNVDERQGRRGPRKACQRPEASVRLPLGAAPLSPFSRSGYGLGARRRVSGGVCDTHAGSKRQPCPCLVYERHRVRPEDGFERRGIAAAEQAELHRQQERRRARGEGRQGCATCATVWRVKTHHPPCYARAGPTPPFSGIQRTASSWNGRLEGGQVQSHDDVSPLLSLDVPSRSALRPPALSLGKACELGEVAIWRPSRSC